MANVCTFLENPFYQLNFFLTSTKIIYWKYWAPRLFWVEMLEESPRVKAMRKHKANVLNKQGDGRLLKVLRKKTSGIQLNKILTKITINSLCMCWEKFNYSDSFQQLREVTKTKRCCINTVHINQNILCPSWVKYRAVRHRRFQGRKNFPILVQQQFDFRIWVQRQFDFSNNYGSSSNFVFPIWIRLQFYFSKPAIWILKYWCRSNLDFSNLGSGIFVFPIMSPAAV